MPRTKSKSSRLAELIDAAQKLTNDLAMFSEQLCDIMAESAKFREIKPRLDQLTNVIMLQGGPETPGSPEPGTDTTPSQETTPLVNRQKHGRKKKDNVQTDTNLGQDTQP